MSALLVGFDSAWTPNNSGALVGLLRSGDREIQEIDLPRKVNYCEAEEKIVEWQTQYKPTTTLVLLDQPTIVKNAAGQRPVENIVGSSVSLRYGGVQPANTSKAVMFGEHAPVWQFLNRFWGPANLLEQVVGTRVFETYPVLAMIALGWTLPDSRPTGRLPKYNPARKKIYSESDWQHVCRLVSSAFRERGLCKLVQWLDEAAANTAPRKQDQDGLDACICLLVALHMAEMQVCLIVGDQATGYIVAPFDKALCGEAKNRCEKTGRAPADWVRSFRLPE